MNFVIKRKKEFFFVCLFFLSFFSFAQKKIQRWEAQADTLMKQEKFKNSATLYSKILSRTKKKSDTYFSVLYKRALCYYRAENFKPAVNDVNAFLKKNNDSEKGYLLRALINQQRGDENNLLHDVNKAIELGNTNPQLIHWRATLLLERGDLKKAKKDFLTLKKISDDAELETNLASAYHALNQSDSAFVCIDRAIELDKNFLGAYLYGASFYLGDEKYDAALTYLNQALTIEPKNGTILFYKGVALVELKRTDEACSCLRKALDAGNDEAVDYLKEYCYDVFK